MYLEHPAISQIKLTRIIYIIIILSLVHIVIRCLRTINSGANLSAHSDTQTAAATEICCSHVSCMLTIAIGRDDSHYVHNDRVLYNTMLCIQSDLDTAKRRRIRRIIMTDFGHGGQYWFCSTVQCPLMFQTSIDPCVWRFSPISQTQAFAPFKWIIPTT